MTRLNQFFREVARTPEVRSVVKQAVEQQLAKSLQHFVDGFEAARRPTASSAADGQYVTSLYRELLGRAPDADGFNAHLAGLKGGVTREQLRQVFLDSSEFKERSAPVTPVTSPEAPRAAAPLSGTEQLRALIAADIKLASGREATASDYAYWLPMLQSECDSGFVTSGQMTGVEYYHRRMLGWQAGGDDQAKFGPYAGGPEAQGPVPSAVEVVGPLR